VLVVVVLLAAMAGEVETPQRGLLWTSAAAVGVV
jgi:hypothetical protein